VRQCDLKRGNGTRAGSLPAYDAKSVMVIPLFEWAFSVNVMLSKVPF
jgi:hypothetical protein